MTEPAGGYQRRAEKIDFLSKEMELFHVDNT